MRVLLLLSVPAVSGCAPRPAVVADASLVGAWRLAQTRAYDAGGALVPFCAAGGRQE